jgi:hypothetical protein
MEPLLFFIFGILFYEFCLPLLESFCSLILTWFETLKTLLNERIAESKRKISKPPEKNPIGFNSD